MKNSFEFAPEEGAPINEQGEGKSLEASKRVTFPHGEEAIRLYKKEYGDNPEEIGEVKDIFDTFFDQYVANIALYKSERGATLPYTRINVIDFAKALYEKYTGKKAVVKPPENGKGTTVETDQKRIKREFVFPGAPLRQAENGPFHYVEEAMHQLVMNLPAALEDLRNGREPDSLEIFTMGTPMNELGTMTPEFFENLKKDPTAEMGNVFAEFIQKNGLAKMNENEKLNIELYGLSWGSSLAAVTGEKLLENEVFTQERDPARNKAMVTIRAQAPVSLGRSMIKKLQIPLGFAADGIASIIREKYGRNLFNKTPKFMEQLNAVLEERGIGKNTSEEQNKMKSAGMKAIRISLSNEVELKPETKVNEIYGLRDMTTYSPGLNAEAKEARERRPVFSPDSLAQNLIEPERKNSRTFAVDTFHMPPWFRKQELKRIKKAAAALNSLKP